MFVISADAAGSKLLARERGRGVAVPGRNRHTSVAGAGDRIGSGLPACTRTGHPFHHHHPECRALTVLVTPVSFGTRVDPLPPSPLLPSNRTNPDSDTSIYRGVVLLNRLFTFPVACGWVRVQILTPSISLDLARSPSHPPSFSPTIPPSHHPSRVLPLPASLPVAARVGLPRHTPR